MAKQMSQKRRQTMRLRQKKINKQKKHRSGVKSRMNREESLQEMKKRRTERMTEELEVVISPATWGEWTQEGEEQLISGRKTQEEVVAQVEAGEEEIHSDGEETIIYIPDEEENRDLAPPDYSPITSPISDWDEVMEEEENHLPPLEEGVGTRVRWKDEEDAEEWRSMMSGQNFDTKMVGDTGFLVSEGFMLAFKRSEQLEEPEQGRGATIEELDDDEADDIIWI
ncbi:hypothetical protein WN55_08621 [Dufourea novaeangliae]|uniref:Uncharacterized protein n=1 Tax=Dufourea novaeangliae TaxID=178035 RepID=A0A154PUJ8_DUFNO|nr:hypothetical protein WN55_08621 [Dufourea novaeangliae]